MHLSRNYLLSQPEKTAVLICTYSSQTLLKNKDVHKLTRIIRVVYDSPVWQQVHGCEASWLHWLPLDNVTVFLLCWIYGPGKDTDRQKPTVPHKPVKPTWYIMHGQKKENHHSFIPPQRNLMQIEPFLTFLGENKSSSQHKQAVRCGRCLGHFTQIKLVCIKQALCVHSSI